MPILYKKLEPGSMLHGYEITNERRTCTDEKVRAELRNNSFYTADGSLYTAENKEVLWGITKLPQNLVLQNLTEAYHQLAIIGNHFPMAEEAKVSFEHVDTVVVDLKGLELVEDNYGYGHFVVEPQKIRKLNSQQKKAVVRLFGPDEESFRLNMEMLAEVGKSPRVYALMPDYVQHTLKALDKQYLGLASRLSNFNNNSNFNANDRNVYDGYRVRGIRRGASETSREESPVGRAPENAGVPLVAVAPEEMRAFSLEQLLACLGDDVAPSVRSNIEERYRKLFKR